MEQYLSELKSKFFEIRPTDATRAVPCSNDDINNLEYELSIKLPLAYCEYLLWMGRGGSFLSSAHCFYPYLSALNAWARKFVSQNKEGLRLPDTAFVFAVDFSEYFYFFNTDEDNDPLVYLYMNSETKDYFRYYPKESVNPMWISLFDEHKQNDFIAIDLHFTQFLQYEMKEYVRLVNDTETQRAKTKPE